MKEQELKRLAVIGCGWLGLPLAEFLTQQGYQVKGSTTREEKIPDLESKGIEAYQIKAEETLHGEDLSSFFDVDALLINIPPGGRRNPEVANRHPRQIKVIVEAARQSRVRRILFISSTGIYGAENGIVTEKDLPNPKTASGEALVMIEDWLQKQPDLEVTILRFSGLVGGERKAGRFLAGKTNVPNGQAPVNLIHRDDCIRIIYQILRQQVWGAVLNACSDKHPSRQKFYTYQAHKEELTPPTFLDQPTGKKGKIISNEKLKKALGYDFLHPDPMTF